jgi:hypothetical protein
VAYILSRLLLTTDLRGWDNQPAGPTRWRSTLPLRYFAAIYWARIRAESSITGNISTAWGRSEARLLGAAVSAVDIVLWDIKGQHYQAPIWDLLGGNCRNRIRLHLLILGDFGPEAIAAKVGEGMN